MKSALLNSSHEGLLSVKARALGRLQSPQHSQMLSMTTRVTACSPFCWASRFALIHKGLKYETVPWHFHEEERIKMSNQGLVSTNRCIVFRDVSKQLTIVPCIMAQECCHC